MILYIKKQAIQYLIDKGANIYQKDFNGKNYLHQCCEFGSFRSLFFFYDKFDINDQDDSGYTALMIAVLNWNEYFIRFLMNQKNINYNLRNNSGDTALHIAIKEQSIKTIYVLLIKGYPKNILNSQQLSAQDLCEAQNESHALKLFVVQQEN